MTLAMCAHIILAANERRNQVEMRRIASAEISQSVHDFCQSATITLPRNVPQLQREELRTYIRRGDAIQVWLGYDGDLVLEFEGFVESVSTDTPVQVKLRDALWKHLQRDFSKSYKDAHVPTVMKDMFGDAFVLDAMDANIGPVRFEKDCTVAKALKALRDEFGLSTYLKEGTLYCGVVFNREPRTVRYAMERNVRDNNLTYRVAEDVKVKVKAKSTKRDGGTVEVEVGDPDGELRTLNYYGITSKEELRKLAEHDMGKIKFDGYEGSVKGYGVPFAQFGDRVALSSALYPERDGQYLAEASTIIFGREGFVRELKLAQRWTP